MDRFEYFLLKFKISVHFCFEKYLTDLFVIIEFQNILVFIDKVDTHLCKRQLQFQFIPQRFHALLVQFQCSR